MATDPSRRRPRSTRSVPFHWWAIASLALVAFVHRRVLDRFFIADDFLHFFQLANDGFARFLVTPHGPHVYVSRNLVWGGLYETFGMNPIPYFALALGLHLVNTWLVGDVARKLGASAPLAALAAACWGAAPVVQGSIAWFSAFGHVIVATCFLVIVRDALTCSLGRIPVDRPRALRWAALLLVASTSYGIGLALSLAAMLFLPLLIDDARDRRRAFSLFATLSLLVVVILAVPWSAGPETTMGARMKGEIGPASIASLFLDVWAHGTANAAFGPLLSASRHGDVTLGPFAGWSVRQTLPVSRTILAIAIAVCVAGAWRADSRRRRWTAALLAIAAIAYASVAIGRVALTGLSDPSYTAATARYHYVAPAAMWLAVCAATAPAFDRTWIRRSAVLALLGFFALALHADQRGAYEPAHQTFATDRDEYDATIAFIDSRLSNNPDKLRLIRNRRFASGTLLARQERFPGIAGVFVIAYSSNEVDGTRVQFVETDPHVIATARSHAGTRIATLLVGPDAVQARRRRRSTAPPAAATAPRDAARPGVVPPDR